MLTKVTHYSTLSSQPPTSLAMRWPEIQRSISLMALLIPMGRAMISVNQSKDCIILVGISESVDLSVQMPSAVLSALVRRFDWILLSTLDPAAIFRLPGQRCQPHLAS